MLTLRAQVYICYFLENHVRKSCCSTIELLKLKVNLILGDPYNRYFDQTTLHFNIFTFFYIFVCLTVFFFLLAFAVVAFYAAHCASERFLIIYQNMWEAGCALKTV